MINGEVDFEPSRTSSGPELPKSQIAGQLWEPGYFKQTPWSAISAIFLALALVSVCVCIVVLSHGKEVETWHIKPSVWLALLSATANACLRYAFVEGTSIFWWNNAVRGATIQDLHRTWMLGTSLRSATTTGRHFNGLALESIAVAIVAIDGTLLQRA